LMCIFGIIAIKELELQITSLFKRKICQKENNKIGEI